MEEFPEDGREDLYADLHDYNLDNVVSIPLTEVDHLWLPESNHKMKTSSDDLCWYLECEGDVLRYWSYCASRPWTSELQSAELSILVEVDLKWLPEANHQAKMSSEASCWWLECDVDVMKYWFYFKDHPFTINTEPTELLAALECPGFDNSYLPEVFPCTDFRNTGRSGLSKRQKSSMNMVIYSWRLEQPVIRPYVHQEL